jgi:H+/Cl- antiporter ClcA
VGFACLGAGAGVLFVRLFRLVGQVAHRLERRPVLLATLGGLAIGLLALVTPGFVPASTLMWGEYEARNVLHTLDPGVAGRGALLVAGGLVILALAKMLAIGCTLHSGFRGGFIFPLFFIGAALGSAVVIATGGAVTPAVAVLCTMAAINVAVTKTPVSTTLILTTLSGTSMMPALAAASIVAFVLTTRISLIGTQRRRQFAPA